MSKKKRGRPPKKYQQQVQHHHQQEEEPEVIVLEKKAKKNDDDEDGGSGEEASVPEETQSADQVSGTTRLNGPTSAVLICSSCSCRSKQKILLRRPTMLRTS